jgi:hypothetical protein
MTTMIAELYDALIAAGSPEEKARKATEAMAGYQAYDQRLGRIEADIGELKRAVGELDRRTAAVERDTLLLKWMVGFVLAFQIAMLAKLFLH